MPRRDEAVFVVHGLDVDAKNVRADVFARKLLTLISGLRDADKFANGKLSYGYVITELKIGSASVAVRQRQRSRRRPLYSAIDVYEQVAGAIYNGDRSVGQYSGKLVQRVGQLSAGAMETFSHAELVFPDDNVIRIDDFLSRQADAAGVLIAEPEGHRDQFYRGRAIGSFDGELQEIDNRGMILRGKLILSPGVEIDCVMNKERVPEAREAFGSRVVVQGTAHYDGEQQLPSRIDVTTIRTIGQRPDLLRWRGAFQAPPETDAEEDDGWH